MDKESRQIKIVGHSFKANRLKFQHSLFTDFSNVVEMLHNSAILSAVLTPIPYKTQKLIDNATELAFRRTTGIKNIDRAISHIDEVEIISVLTKLMKMSYTFTKGWSVAEDALQIKCSLCIRRAFFRSGEAVFTFPLKISSLKGLFPKISVQARLLLIYSGNMTIFTTNLLKNKGECDMILTRLSLLFYEKPHDLFYMEKSCT